MKTSFICTQQTECIFNPYPGGGCASFDWGACGNRQAKQQAMSGNGAPKRFASGNVNRCLRITLCEGDAETCSDRPEGKAKCCHSRDGMCIKSTADKAGGKRVRKRKYTAVTQTRP